MPKKSASITVGSTDLAKEGIRMSFPVKLHQMLEQADERGFSHIVSWNKEGNGFCVANVEVFVREIIPQYYSISKYKSFQVRRDNLMFERLALYISFVVRRQEEAWDFQGRLRHHASRII